MQYSYLDSQLHIGKKQIDFLSPIKDVLETENFLLVLLQRIGIELDHNESMNRNIIAFNSSGQRIWTIQESPSGGKRDKPFTAIYSDNDKIVAYNGLGFEYELNLETGSVMTMGNRPW